MPLAMNSTEMESGQSGFDFNTLMSEMDELKRVARRHFEGIGCHDLSSWRPITPLHWEAKCKCCGRIHSATIQIENSSMVRLYGCSTGIGTCLVSERGRIQAREFAKLVEASGGARLAG